uniref:Sin3a_C domain-containing protein n=1 Tax=Steinernema glaseri TaxID=37863 RepID=A0A1I7Z3R6_9BILA
MEACQDVPVVSLGPMEERLLAVEVLAPGHLSPYTDFMGLLFASRRNDHLVVQFYRLHSRVLVPNLKTEIFRPILDTYRFYEEQKAEGEKAEKEDAEAQKEELDHLVLKRERRSISGRNCSSEEEDIDRFGVEQNAKMGVMASAGAESPRSPNRRRFIPRSVMGDGTPAPRLNLDQLLFQNGLIRVSESREHRMGIYHVICKQLHIPERKARLLSHIVEDELRAYYNTLAEHGQQRFADCSNDRFRVLSRLFRCRITIFGLNDIKHHRHFSSDDDVFSIMLFEVRHGRYEALDIIENENVAFQGEHLIPEPVVQPYCGTQIFYELQERYLFFKM